MPSLRVVIVNWNSGTGLRKCLESFAIASLEGFTLENVIVVDNASEDGSIEGLSLPLLPLQILRNETNQGFAAGCNRGAAGSRADYVLFLNPDTELLEYSLSAPVAFMERPENAQIGICGISLLDDSGRLARHCARFPTTTMFLAKALGVERWLPATLASHKMIEWDHLESRPVDQVIGAFYFVRRQLFERLGGFDERFFVYFEDVDFARRAAQLGFASYYLADGVAYHEGGGSSRRAQARRLAYSVRSRLHYGWKHYGGLSFGVLAVASLVLEPLSRSVFCLARGSLGDCGATARGFGLVWSDLIASIEVCHRGHGTWGRS